MPKYVVDAKVVVKWYDNEEYRQQADAVKVTAEELLAPNIILVEALNALTQKLRRREITEDAVRLAYSDLLSILDLYPTTPLVADALDISVQAGINLYDAVYVALAIAQGCQVVTADAGLINSTYVRLRGVVLPLHDVPTG